MTSRDEKADNRPDSGQASAAPSISLPKGGGAIRGMGEKFAANPVTGTGSMSAPIATSPGRSGFGPQLSLSYDSGAGNGPFGFGWSLSLPSITRKTEKGLPQYRDAADSDVFTLSGAEDLVPEFEKGADGNWVLHEGKPVIHDKPRMVDGITYRVRRYRPRIEGLFARIECWTRLDDPADVHWRSISRDNILTLYGLDANSRITDPLDAGRIFSWLICETRDDKGNAVLYRYKAEDGTRVDLGQAHERNRGPRDDPRRAANRYLKRIHYGNRAPLLDNAGRRPHLLDAAQIAAQIASVEWMFEVVFDYDDHDPASPRPRDDEALDAAGGLEFPWKPRNDPFSTYRAGFEVRTTRLCQRVLMFHHFPGEDGVGADCLVRSTDFAYSDEVDPTDVRNPVHTFLRAVTQTGYKRNNGGYDQRSLPPVEFKYTEPVVQETVEEVDPESLENLPIGLDGSAYRWTDLHGEGIPGILTEQAGAWFYKRNLSPIPEPVPGGGERVTAKFAPLETVALKPSLALAEGAEFMDLAGDGLPDVVVLDGPTPGLYEHDEAEGWQPFRPYTSRLNRDFRDPNLKLVDLNGDGHADVLISEDDAFVWHPSLEEAGFGPARRVAQSFDEEKGPRIVFADASQSIHLADLSGDGLTDIVRIRNGEVCYWPNLGYGRFGAKVTMDHAPWFDHPDQFDPKRLRLADIDGSGATDLIYLHRDGVRLYFNQSGNSWSEPRILKVFPRVDDLVSITPVDLLGNGTACLVWSSPMPGDASRPMRYVNLMGEHKPHLLIKTVNNLGAETRVHYAPSTKFYLQDKRDGKPWVTRLPFPVHVVERVETYDHISRNRFVSRYAYHHGYFDGEEREFRGFGMVEQWDTEAFAALSESPLPIGWGEGQGEGSSNLDAASHVPAVLTRTWFHTGAYLGRNHVSDYFAGLLDEDDVGEYYREPGLTDAEARALLLPDTVLPDGLTPEEEREACRALKGMMLRQEVYALDGKGADENYPNGHPYTVLEQNFTIKRLQPRPPSLPRTREWEREGVRADTRHAVFFSHPREAITYHYERNPADPRIQHALTLEADDYGNVLKEAAIGYGRRIADASLPTEDDRLKQTRLLLTYTENRVTNAIESPDAHRTPLPCEARTYELTGFKPENNATRFSFDEWTRNSFELPASAMEIPYEQTADNLTKQKRLIEHVRTLYRRDDLTSLLPFGELHSLALPGETYKLAFTPGLLNQVFRRPRVGQPLEVLLPNPATVLGGQAGDRGGYLPSQTLKANGRFPANDPDDHWWIPSGRSFFTTDPADNAAVELAEARNHFFLPRRYRDPFGQDAFVDFDAHDLLMVETRDALGNRVTVGEREHVLPDGTVLFAKAGNDYRVLQPRLVSDPNRNRTEVAFDILGLVVGTAVMGKAPPAPVEGDSLANFSADRTQAELDAFFEAANPHAGAAALLQDATTRIIYDLDRFHRTRQAHPDDPAQWQPACAATLARETHVSAPLPPHGLKIQISFSYSDGFGREIQKKIQAEPGPLDLGDPQSPILNPRWVGSGWTIFNNKGKPVRQYEPFFSQRQDADGSWYSDHRFEFGVIVGVSPILFYDPAERVVATLHPNHTYEKVVFDPWRQTTYDVNDTCAPRNAQTGDPRTDPDVGGYVAEYFRALAADPTQPWQTWHELRTAPAHAAAFAARFPDARARANETTAATRAAAHTDTPTTAHFDALGRPFLTVAHNRSPLPLGGGEGQGEGDQFYPTRVELDVEGNQRAVRDAIRQAGDPLGRIVMRYAYDLLGNRIHQLSMEAGARWMLNDVTGKPIRAWDSRGHKFTTTYDTLRRPTEQYVLGTFSDPDPLKPNSDPRTLNPPNPTGLLVDKIEYGEPPPNASQADENRAQEFNLRTRIYRHWDSAGVVTNAQLDDGGAPVEAHDFKGNLLRSTRRLASDYQAIPDWSQNPQLDAETFEGGTRYDALNRPIQSTAPHSSLPHARRNIIQPVFNEANLLERVDVWLERPAEPTALLDPNTEPPSPVGVANIDYDAKGQRLRIDYKNGASTLYDYDPLTFRLTHLLTRRHAAAFPDDDPQPPIAGWPGRLVQNLRYTYDPAGNITHIHDDAQQRIYFRNRRVEPSNDYTYDALYRLIQATGREHLGQIGGEPIPHSHDDAGRMGLLHPGDGHAMGTYTERYVYDAVGNFLQMQHRGDDPTHAGWTRGYAYEETSLIEDGTGGTLLKTSNRLSHTTVGTNNPSVERYLHDAHGNMTRMPHLGGPHPDPNMHWDYKDQLRQTDLGGGGTAWYTYDASGERVRKVWEKSPGLTEERIYLGGFEIFRKHNGSIGANTATLERETLHVMDDKQRIALVETRTLDTADDDPAPRQLIRYQFGNHLGSTSLELDEQGQIISYEEYAPYGSTTYEAVRSQTETAKRYRYTGKERDEESGLYYHGARYYASWVNTWISCDPASVEAGINLYQYCAGSPTRLIDPNGKDPKPFDPQKGNRFVKWLLYRNDTPILDTLTSDKNLQTAQNFSADVAIGAGTLATGGALAGAAAGAGLSATVAGAVAGLGSSSFSLGARSVYEGKDPTASQVAKELAIGTLAGAAGGMAQTLGAKSGVAAGAKPSSPSQPGAPPKAPSKKPSTPYRTPAQRPPPDPPYFPNPSETPARPTPPGPGAPPGWPSPDKVTTASPLQEAAPQAATSTSQALPQVELYPVYKLFRARIVERSYRHIPKEVKAYLTRMFHKYGGQGKPDMGHSYGGEFSRKQPGDVSVIGAEPASQNRAAGRDIARANQALRNWEDRNR